MRDLICRPRGCAIAARRLARQRVAAALSHLAAHVDDPSFVQSFAYATGSHIE